MIASPRRRFIVLLDTTLLIIFILLLSPRLTGLPLHEISGLHFLYSCNHTPSYSLAMDSKRNKKVFTELPADVPDSIFFLILFYS